jgi:hypothetical protein
MADDRQCAKATTATVRRKVINVPAPLASSHEGSPSTRLLTCV